MRTIDEFGKLLTGPHILEQLTELLRNNDDEFVQYEANYRSAVQALYAELPADLSPSLDDYLRAYETDITSVMVYAGYLGYRVNLENYHQPFGVDFLSRDTIDNVKDHLFYRFPVNDGNAEIRDTFLHNLPQHLKDVCCGISDYFISLECMAPKLAHYAGYIIANDFLQWVEPGYRPDEGQTAAYTMEMIGYLGFSPL